MNSRIAFLFSSLVIFLITTSISASDGGNETDLQALLQFKLMITNEALSSWSTFFHHCSWKGVTCGMQHERVAALQLDSQGLQGSLSPYVGNLSFLQIFSLANNSFQGTIPDELGRLSRLQFLNLGSNKFNGVIPQCLGNITSLQYLIIKSNQIQGPFPSSFCNMIQLVRLDMSNNNFDGVIPQCLGNISSFLLTVDMGNNHFYGTIPNVYKNCRHLEGFILNGNQLQGEIPSSLSNCLALKVLNLGNNQLNGTFPGWLGNLPMLQVLVLRSNKLHGPIENSSTNKSVFRSMRVLDLSHNGFGGHLPEKHFQNFSAMKEVVRNSSTPKYLTMGGSYYSIIVAVKGVERVISKILVDYTILDLSNNKFEGEITGVIGSLTSLKVLNLSHNSLTGQIPYVLGNLSEIESLDLSWNQLSGAIPQSLADLTFLGSLNLSENHLVGRIPLGTQFSTFETSFGGNQALYGPPLPKKCCVCELPIEPHPEVDGEADPENEFTWIMVMLGYGCGIVIGLVMGYVMLSTGRPKWFNEIADAGEPKWFNEIADPNKGNNRRSVCIRK